MSRIFSGGCTDISWSRWPIKQMNFHLERKICFCIIEKMVLFSFIIKKITYFHMIWEGEQLHCLDAAKITRCNLSTRFSEIEEDRSVNKGVTLLAPNSWKNKYNIGVTINVWKEKSWSTNKKDKLLHWTHTAHFSTSQSARPPFNVPTEIRASLVIIVDLKPHSVGLDIRITDQKQQIRAIVELEDRLILCLLKQWSPTHNGRHSECSLWLTLLFHWRVLSYIHMTTLST